MPSTKKRSRFSWFSDSSDNAVSDVRAELETLSESISVGRLVQKHSEERIRRESEVLSTLLLGSDLSRLPEPWREPSMYGIVSADLVDAVNGVSPILAVAPGWGYHVASVIRGNYFVVETRAFLAGPWTRCPFPGGGRRERTPF